MDSDKQLRIVYMGTPDFAVEPLKAMLDEGFNVVGVVTMPDKPAGRGHRLLESPVKKFAKEHDLPLLQPAKLRDENFLIDLKTWDADLQVVVAFRMLPEVVWNMPRLGTLNLHASLLPEYRGAAPINWAIINGETRTGVTTFLLKHEIDTGNLLMQEAVEILPTDNVGSLHDKLMHVGSQVLVRTLNRLEAGDMTSIPQDESKAIKPAPKIFKDDCRVRWEQPGVHVVNFVRGLSPYPAAFADVLDDKGQQTTIKLLEVAYEKADQQLAPGTLDSDGKRYLRFAVTDGWVKVLEVQMAGKKAMRIEEFLRGTRLRSSI
ncbi:MAG: methionyl-tRNA formyltransferase [Paludibacteraceae bacterium]|nr:methionyl-tRNA formyltransferase [Paludibacteraceae bacterium]